MKKLSLFLLLPILSFSQEKVFSKIPLDKSAHLLAGSTISAVTYSIVYDKTKSKKKALLYSLATPLIIGTLKEVYDSNQPRNRFNNGDLGATVLGGLSVTLVFDIFCRDKKQYKPTEINTSLKTTK